MNFRLTFIQEIPNNNWFSYIFIQSNVLLGRTVRVQES